MREERQIGFNRGIRACISWLHARADMMNDLHARAILNSAGDYAELDWFGATPSTDALG